MRVDELGVDVAMAVAATERVTLGLRECPVTVPAGLDEVAAHVWMIADLRGRVSGALESLDGPDARA